MQQVEDNRFLRDQYKQWRKNNPDKAPHYSYRDWLMEHANKQAQKKQEKELTPEFAKQGNLKVHKEKAPEPEPESTYSEETEPEPEISHAEGQYNDEKDIEDPKMNGAKVNGFVVQPWMIGVAGVLVFLFGFYFYLTLNK